MSPEYAYWGHVSTKSDMFSFGVIVLEMVTGRRNNSAYDSAVDSVSVLSHVSAHYFLGNNVPSLVEQRSSIHNKNLDDFLFGKSFSPESKFRSIRGDTFSSDRTKASEDLSRVTTRVTTKGFSPLLSQMRCVGEMVRNLEDLLGI